MAAIQSIGPPRIIVVEDESITAMDIQRQLVNLGYVVPAVASTGEQAIAKIAEFHPDLVLMDIVLQGTMDGVETAELVRSRFRIPVIYLTAFSDNATLRRAGITEPFGFILKPFEERDLHTTIEMALYKHGMEKRFRSIVEGTEAGYFRIGRDGRFEAVNAAWLKMHGYASEDEIVGQHFSVTQVESDLEGAKNVVERVIGGEAVSSGEFTRRRKDGSVGYHSFSVQPVLHRGTVVGLEGFMIDMTESKLAGEALRAIGERQGLLVRLLPMAFYTARTTGNMATTWISEQVQQITGFSPHEFTDDAMFWSKRLHPDDKVRVLAEYTSVLQKRSVATEYRWRCADGTYRWFMDLIALACDDRGEPLEIIGTWLDSTERKKTEDQLRQLSRAVEQSPASVVITDVAGSIVYVNRKFTQVSGYSFEDVVGKNPSILKSGLTPPETYQHLWKTISSGSEWQGEMQNKKKNGDLYWEYASISPIIDPEGHTTHFLAVKEDMTDQKQLEQQLRQAQKMESMGTLVGGISHDFNNILNNILGFVFQLRKYSDDPMKVAKYTDTIEKSATRGAELANQLLSFVRHNKEEVEQVEVGALVAEVAGLLRETLPKNIVLDYKVDGQSLFVLGGRGELYQVLLNLCLNARDAMPEGGKLVIEAARGVVGGEFNSAVVASPLSQGQSCVQIRVSDSGTGIPEDIRDKIFDPLFTTRERGRGTGLGLSVVYNNVKRHKGTIVVRSEEGKGSSFTVYLPTVDEPAIKKVTAGNEFIVPAHPRHLLLLVDDETAMIELGRELLEDDGYDVLTARDGMQAVEIYRNRWREIDLVILDLVMPKLDGGQAFLEMKKINPALKAFFCTGYSSDQMITSLLAEERLQALQKPFRPREFTQMVQQVLSQ